MNGIFPQFVGEEDVTVSLFPNWLIPSKIKEKVEQIYGDFREAIIKEDEEILMLLTSFLDSVNRR